MNKETVIKKLSDYGVAPADIIFPAENVDLTRFSCVACDQYSANPEYWQQVKDFVGDAPSSLNMMLPEAWLDDETHQAKIPAAMDKYLKDGSLKEIGQGMVFVHRACSSGIRKGVVLNLDLSKYEYTPGNKALIRATEKTVEQRLPARIAIRKSVPMEMPHVMVLIADKENKLMNYLDEKVASNNTNKLYDFDLMQKSGHLEGWFIDDPAIWDEIADVLAKLASEAEDGMLFAVGDGNHSLAAAKKCGSRYAMVEIVNLYDPALEFEPIHRLLMNVDPKKVQEEVGFNAEDPLDLQELQPMLDAWLEKHPEASIEYIHGKEECIELGKKDGNLAICWDEFPKDSLFTAVAKNGVLQRKSFSMGSAPDKRFYLECQKIR